MLIKNPLVHGTVVMDKKCLITVGNYSKNIAYEQDYEFLDTKRTGL